MSRRSVFIYSLPPIYGHPMPPSSSISTTSDLVAVLFTRSRSRASEQFSFYMPSFFLLRFLLPSTRLYSLWLTRLGLGMNLHFSKRESIFCFFFFFFTFATGKCLRGKETVTATNKDLFLSIKRNLSFSSRLSDLLLKRNFCGEWKKKRK